MRFDAKTRAGVSVTAALLLSACATAAVYGPLGPKSAFGYTDMHNADGSHTVRVIADAAPRAHEFWDRRAQEICGGSTYRKNIFRAQRPVVTQYGYASNGYGGGGSYSQDVYGAFELEGYLRCDSAATPDAAPQVAPEAVPEPASDSAASPPAPPLQSPPIVDPPR